MYAVLTIEIKTRIFAHIYWDTGDALVRNPKRKTKRFAVLELPFFVCMGVGNGRETVGER